MDLKFPFIDLLKPSPKLKPSPYDHEFQELYSPILHLRYGTEIKILLLKDKQLRS
jgi:hypothetical protein